MRLYPKKIHSIEDLERERKLLMKERKKLDKEPLLPEGGLSGLFSGGGDKEKGGGFDISQLLTFLPFMQGPLGGVVTGIVKRWFSKKNKNRSSRYASDTDDAQSKPGKSKLASIALEFIGGYLKWKAIELSYKMMRKMVKERREKREREANV